MSSVLPPVGEEIAAHITDFLKGQGLEEPEAQSTGEKVAEILVQVFAGQKISFPNPNRRSEIRRRNAEIRRLFDGTNAPVLAHRFGVSRSRIWQIVKSKSSTG